MKYLKKKREIKLKKLFLQSQNILISTNNNINKNYKSYFNKIKINI